MLGALTVAVNHEISRPVLRFPLIKNGRRILNTDHQSHVERNQKIATVVSNTGMMISKLKFGFRYHYRYN